MSRNLTLPLLAVGAGAFKTSVEFESSMAKVKAVSGATGKEFKELEKKARALGSSTTFTASEVSSLQLEFAKLGFSSIEINEVTEATLNLAQATGSDLAEAAAVAGATLGGFQLQAKETTRVTDVMAAAFSSTPLDISSFRESMKNVAPVAEKAGVSLEQASAMLGVLAKAGIKGSRAGSALRRILSDLGATGGNVGDAIKKLSEKGLTMGGAMDEVGRSAQTALLVLSSGTDDVDELTKSFENSSGKAKEMSDIMNDNAKGSIKEMMSAIEGVAISIGKILTPTLQNITKTITALAQKFESLSKPTQKIITGMFATAAAVGPLMYVLGGLGGTVLKLVGLLRMKRLALIADAAASGTATVASGGFSTATLISAASLKAFRTALISTGIGALVVGLGLAAGALFEFIGKSNDATKSERDMAAAVLANNNMLRERRKILGGSIGDKSIKDLRATTAAIQSEIDALDANDLIAAMTKAGGILKDGAADVLSSTLQDAALRFQTLLTGDDMVASIQNFDGFIGGRGAEIIKQAVSQTRAELVRQRKEAEDALSKLQTKANAGGAGGEDAATTSAASLRSEFVQLKKEIGFIKRQVNDGGIVDIDHLSDLETKFSKVVNLAKDLKVNLSDLQAPEAMKGVAADVETIFNSLDKSVQKTLSSTANKLHKSTPIFEELFENMRLKSEALQNTFEASFGIMSSSMQQMTSEGASGFESLATSIGRAVRQIISAQIAQAVSMALIDALKKSGGNPFVGGVLAAAGATAAKGLFDRMIPQFALGGIVTKPTLGLVGEAGTEAIVPFNRMGEFMKMAGVGNTGGKMAVSGRLSGNDIFLSNQFSQNQSARRRVVI